MARPMIAISYRTDEALLSPLRVWEPNQGNAIGTQKGNRESDEPIVPKKAGKPVGGKGYTFSSVSRRETVQTGELSIWCTN